MRTSLIHIFSLIICSITPGIIIVGYFAMAAIFASSLDSFARQLPEMFLLVTYVAAAHALLLGLPIYLLVQRYFNFTYKITALCGFIVGLTPIAIFSWPLQYSDTKASASANGVQKMINGVPTMAGWFSYLQGTVTFGLLGLAGALMFKYSLSKLKKTNELSKNGTGKSGAF